MSTPIWDPDSEADYLKWLLEWAKVHSDGCTKCLDIHVHCCYQHDHAYQTGFDAYSVYKGTPQVISRRDADAQFRRCMERESVLGRFSPVAWVRWSGVRLFGRWFYDRGKTP